MRQYSTSSGWTARIDAYQAHLEEEKHRARLRAIERAHEEHPKLARGLQDAGANRLASLGEDVSQLSPGEARKFIVDGIRLERSLLGIPLESNTQLTQVNVSQSTQNTVQLALEEQVKDAFNGYMQELDASSEREQFLCLANRFRQKLLAVKQPVFARDPERERREITSEEFERELAVHEEAQRRQRINFMQAFVRVCGDRREQKALGPWPETANYRTDA